MATALKLWFARLMLRFCRIETMDYGNKMAALGRAAERSKQ